MSSDKHGLVGKLIMEKFGGQKVEIFTNMDSETLLLEQFSTNNKFILTGIAYEYHEEAGMLELKDPFDNSFYIQDFYIIMFFEPGFDYTNCLSNMIKTGKALYNKKNRDIM